MTENEHQLVVEQLVPASPEAVFKAWTTSSELQQWWGPPGGRCVEAVMDLRVGGKYLIRNELPDGNIVRIEGEFLQIQEPDHVSYTWTTDAMSSQREHVVVAFDSHNEGTLVTVTHSRIADAKAIEGHEQGWVACLSGLRFHMANA